MRISRMSDLPRKLQSHDFRLNQSLSTLRPEIIRRMMSAR